MHIRKGMLEDLRDAVKQADKGLALEPIKCTVAPSMGLRYGSKLGLMLETLSIYGVCLNVTNYHYIFTVRYHIGSIKFLKIAKINTRTKLKRSLMDCMQLLATAMKYNSYYEEVAIESIMDDFELEY